jgi:hypothetical protein
MQLFLNQAAEWFTTIKAVDLSEAVRTSLELIEKKQALADNQKKLIGFILFDYSMHQGPQSFLKAEEAARNVGVLDEMMFYANDWMNYSKKSAVSS